MIVSIKFTCNYFNNEINGSSALNFIAVQIYLIIQSIIIIIFIVNLILLHVWLYKNSMTTYELIKMRNKRRKKIQVASFTEMANSKVTMPQSPRHKCEDN